MPIISYAIPATGRKVISYYNDSQSNKVGNRVITSTQSKHVFRKGVSVIDRSSRLPWNGVEVFAADAQEALSFPPQGIERFFATRVAEARARFDGKVREGKADLGVTLGSWRQSWDMIARRAGQARTRLKKVADSLEKDYNTSRTRHQMMIRARNRRDSRFRGDNQYLETPANLVLEGEFGWLPLFTDAKAAFGVMTSEQPNGWVTGRSTGTIFQTDITEGNPRRIVEFSGKIRVSIAANVWVDNPNLWLANKLGLLNLPGVAWDLVPWSFVVNMFTNLGQIANSFTAHYGLSVNNTSTTYSQRLMRDEQVIWSGADPALGRVLVTHKDRDPGPIPFPPFIFKMPQLNAELALIALSLAVQQVSRITRLIR